MKRIGTEVSFRKLGPSYVIDQNGKKVLFPTSPDGIFKSGMFTFFEKIRLIGLLLKIKKGAFNEGYMDVSLRDWMNLNKITGRRPPVPGAPERLGHGVPLFRKDFGGRDVPEPAQGVRHRPFGRIPGRRMEAGVLRP